MNDETLTLTAYFAERQRSGHRFSADALLDLFERRRIATSVMVRGIASFGPANVTRSDRSLSLSEDPPVSVWAIDTPDRISAVADDAAALIGRGVLTVENGRSLRADEPVNGDTVRLALHLGRRQRLSGAPGYLAVCDVLHAHGFVGADVYLGVDGTVDGARRRAHFFSRNSEVPLSVVGVGTTAQAVTAAAELRTALPDALFGISPTRVCKNDGRHVSRPMPSDGPYQRLTVHTAEASRHRGQPIHRALVHRLKNSDHASGATVLRAIWGFRGAERPHGDRLLQVSRQVPVTTVLIDTATNIAASYPIVDELTEHEGLVTVEAIPGLLEVNGDQRFGSLHP